MAETERLLFSSEIFIINATAASVDVYINFLSQPTISDPKPLVLSPSKDEFGAPVFVAKGDYATPYGVYTFSIRPKGQPDAEVLGEASIALLQGRSYTGVFHELAEGQFQFSIYENHLSDGDLARLTVVHAGQADEIAWQLFPNGERPDIPPDVRSGVLQKGQWQTSANITDNDYVIEFFVEGELVARNPDLDLARQKTFVVVFFGAPQPGGSAQELLRPIVYQELEFDAGPSEPTGTTPPAPPLTSADHNAPIEFTCEPITIWETNATTDDITATDPDGRVVNLSVGEIAPPVGGIEIHNDSVRPSTFIGAPASAELTIAPGIPAGTYTVTIVANRGSMAHQGSCALELTVKPITIERLRALTDGYRQSGDIEPDAADALIALLNGAERHLQSNDVEQACQYLKDVLGLLGSQKGKAVSDAAHDHLERECKALRENLQCG